VIYDTQDRGNCLLWMTTWVSGYLLVLSRSDDNIQTEAI